MINEFSSSCQHSLVRMREYDFDAYVIAKNRIINPPSHASGPIHRGSIDLSKVAFSPQILLCPLFQLPIIWSTNLLFFFQNA